ncbi:hypothetical protein F4861DRAFT_510504 [Xylaria intraflava]|nr:hypothetical protein F4861DRAFT_510504 [Xylaria intraflava]
MAVSMGLVWIGEVAGSGLSITVYFTPQPLVREVGIGVLSDAICTDPGVQTCLALGVLFVFLLYLFTRTTYTCHGAGLSGFRGT